MALAVSGGDREREWTSPWPRPTQLTDAGRGQQPGPAPIPAVSALESSRRTARCRGHPRPLRSFRWLLLCGTLHTRAAHGSSCLSVREPLRACGMEGKDNLSSQPPGASLSECELADQNVGVTDHLVAVIADILLFRDDSHVVSLVLVSPRLRFLGPEAPRAGLSRRPSARPRSGPRNDRLRRPQPGGQD